MPQVFLNPVSELTIEIDLRSLKAVFQAFDTKREIPTREDDLSALAPEDFTSCSFKSLLQKHPRKSFLLLPW